MRGIMEMSIWRDIWGKKRNGGKGTKKRKFSAKSGMVVRSVKVTPFWSSRTLVHGSKYTGAWGVLAPGATEIAPIALQGKEPL